MRTHRVAVNLSAAEYSRLQELRPEGMADAAVFRALLREAGPLGEPPTRMEALRLLAASARAGSTAAQIALARETRAGDQDAVMDWINNG